MVDNDHKVSSKGIRCDKVKKGFKIVLVKVNVALETLLKTAKLIELVDKIRHWDIWDIIF